VRLYEHGERIPLTIERSDPDRGTINLVVQSAGSGHHAQACSPGATS